MSLSATVVESSRLSWHVSLQKCVGNVINGFCMINQKFKYRFFLIFFCLNNSQEQNASSV